MFLPVRLKFYSFILIYSAFFKFSLNDLPKKCDIVLNEINTDCPGDKDFFEFIELAAVYCGNNRPSLQPYVVLLIEEYHAKLNGPAIIFSADLYHQTIRSTNFFVIGSPNTELGPDLSFLDNAVGFQAKPQLLHRGQQPAISSFFTKANAPPQAVDVLNNGNHAPVAAILLKVLEIERLFQLPRKMR